MNIIQIKIDSMMKKNAMIACAVNVIVGVAGVDVVDVQTLAMKIKTID